MKTKKLMNAPDDVVSELVEGMISAHPDILTKEGETDRVIVAVNGPRDGKVGIVIGGGSGHEPAFSGYVGTGLADAAAIGNVFASPSPDPIIDAAIAADGGAGVVFLYGNYTGDVMNFAMASEELANIGIQTTSVLVTDDVASAPKNKTIDRRGIAGGFFVFKCAGAAADLGYDYEDVIRLSEHANSMTRSSGVALGACSLPQTCRANFEIGPMDMEIGMGIHGEPGIKRTRLQTADKVVDQLVDLILADIALENGDKVAVLVNGLGATSLMELYIIHRHLKSRLTDQEITIHHSWVGNYVTALEMAGVSISLLKLDDQLTALLDHPCHTPALQVGRISSTTGNRSERKNRTPQNKHTEQSRKNLKRGGEITPEIFKKMMISVADEIRANRDYLCELDGVVGDGDHGIAMDTGWNAIREIFISSNKNKTISMMCEEMAGLFLSAVGASVGPLYASGFKRAAHAVDDRLNLDPPAMVRWLDALSQGIMKRGGATCGEKTMMDVWIPAVAAAKLEQTVLGGLNAASVAAEIGMNATKDMKASRGRAAKLGDRSIGHTDPGAASAYLIVRTMNTTAHREL